MTLSFDARETQKQKHSMKRKNKPDLQRTFANALTPRRVLPALAVAAALLPGSRAEATLIDLVTTYPNSGSFAAGTSPGGNNVVYSTIDTLPAGTGVFDPFLTYQKKDVEQGFNTSQGGSGQGFMDDKRVDQWTHDLHLSELAIINHNGVLSYAFELDANETGGGNANKLLSIDDIRIYTSPTDTAASVGDDASLVNSLGTLRYAQNATLGTTANYVLIDASNSEGGHTSGSGSSDMIVYVPTALFAGASGSDFVYFYTINGVHDGTDEGSQGNSGFEEWRAVVNIEEVPDNGSTLALLGLGVLGLGFFAHGRKNVRNA